jgi:hypothetical protein
VLLRGFSEVRVNCYRYSEKYRKYAFAHGGDENRERRTMSSIAATDRRIHPRFRLPHMYTSVTAQVAGSDDVRTLEGHAYDISEGGVRLELDEPVESGNHLSLFLGLPGQSAEVLATGKVVWVNDSSDDPGPRRMAVQFIEFLTDDDRRRLREFLGLSHGEIAADIVAA